jgi:hypothetical protein
VKALAVVQANKNGLAAALKDQGRRKPLREFPRPLAAFMIRSRGDRCLGFPEKSFTVYLLDLSARFSRT